MAGNSNSRRSGTYRPGTHDRADERYTGEPVMPKNLGHDGEQMWRQIVESTPPGILATADTAMMTGLCRWWALWKYHDAIVLDSVKTLSCNDRPFSQQQTHGISFRRSLSNSACRPPRGRSSRRPGTPKTWPTRFWLCSVQGATRAHSARQ